MQKSSLNRQLLVDTLNKHIDDQDKVGKITSDLYENRPRTVNTFIKLTLPKVPVDGTIDSQSIVSGHNPVSEESAFASQFGLK